MNATELLLAAADRLETQPITEDVDASLAVGLRKLAEAVRAPLRGRIELLQAVYEKVFRATGMGVVDCTVLSGDIIGAIEAALLGPPVEAGEPAKPKRSREAWEQSLGVVVAEAVFGPAAAPNCGRDRGGAFAVVDGVPAKAGCHAGCKKGACVCKPGCQCHPAAQPLNSGPAGGEANVCEHGDHPAPAGKRFCSYACETCEVDGFGRVSDGCTGLCERIRKSEAETGEG